MATTDDYVKYDVLFFNEFSEYLNLHKSKEVEKIVEMGLLQRDRLIEMAICRLGNMELSSQKGHDLTDFSEVKTVVSGVRNNHKERGVWMHSLKINKISNKTGPLRIVGYNRLLDSFHYFFIPREAYEHCSHSVEIVLERCTMHNGSPDFTGKPQRHRKWWQYEVESFEQLCKMTRCDIKPNLTKEQCNEY